jgi:hypothetical protein
MDALMISRCLVLVFGAVALAGCCMSGTGCYAPVAGAPIAWDGLGSPPTDEAADLNPDVAEGTEARPRKKTRPKREIIVGPLGGVSSAANPKSRASEEWAQQEAADQADDIKLKKQLKICSNCMASPARGDTADGMSR